MTDKKPGSGGFMQAMAITTVLSMEMAITVTLGFFGGRLLDKQFHTEPWVMVTGILLGVAVGIWGIISTLQRFWKEK
jgi:F0F1-type ATP synthase assembly protein I